MPPAAPVISAVLPLQSFNNVIWLVAANDVHFGVAFDKAGNITVRLANHFDFREALEHFIPQYLQLQFGQTIAETTVNAETE